jgi:outer membrane protein assembly factor BamB
MRTAAFVSILSASLAVPCLGQEADLAWPGWRGPQRDGIARGARPPLKWNADENLAWRTELPGPGSSSPIVAGDRVYLTCYSGFGAHVEGGGEREALRQHFVCLERATGKLVFDKRVEGKLRGAPPRVQVAEHGFASPTPITGDGETFYVYFGDAGLFAFDRTGEVRWQADLGAPDPEAPVATNQVVQKGKVIPLRWGTASSPLLFEDLVIVNASEQSNSIRAFDKKAGKLVWKHESSNLEGCSTSPALAGPADARVLVIVLGGEVWGMDPRSGKVLWSVETGTRGGMSPTPVADEQVVYALGGGGEGFALRVAAELSAGSERVVWKGPNQDIPSPILCGERLLLVQTNGTALSVLAKDGTTEFKERLEGRTAGIYASPVLVEDRLYVVSRKRGTFVYSADGKFTLLAHNELDGDESQFNASPAVAGGELFLRSDRYAYCVRGS